MAITADRSGENQDGFLGRLAAPMNRCALLFVRAGRGRSTSSCQSQRTICAAPPDSPWRAGKRQAPCSVRVVKVDLVSPRLASSSESQLAQADCSRL